jgi:hypothetical protein
MCLRAAVTINIKRGPEGPSVQDGKLPQLLPEPHATPSDPSILSPKLQEVPSTLSPSFWALTPPVRASIPDSMLSPSIPVGGASANDGTNFVSSALDSVIGTVDHMGLAPLLKSPAETLAEMPKLPEAASRTEQAAAFPGHWSDAVGRTPLHDPAGSYTNSLIDVPEYRAGSTLQGQPTVGSVQVWSRAVIYPYV